MFVFCFSLVLVSGFVIHEFRVAGKKEKDKERRTAGGNSSKDGNGDGNGDGDGDGDVPLLQRDMDPTGLSDPLPSSSGGIYEDNVSSAQQQQQAMMAQQQQLMQKLDMLLTLMQRDLASRGVH